MLTPEAHPRRPRPPATPPVPAAGRPGAEAVLLVAASLTVMAGAVIAPVLAVLGDELGLSDTETGLVLTTHALSVALASPLVGRLVDRHGTRRVLTAGLVTYGLAGAAGAAADGPAALLAVRAIFGIGAAAVFTATTVAFLRDLPGPAQERAMGRRGAATSLGGVVWPLVEGVAAVLGWRATFVVYAVGLPLAVAAWRLLPAQTPQRSAGPVAGGPARPLRQRRVAVLCGLFTAGTALLYVVLAFLPARLADHGHGSPMVAAAFGAAMSLAMTVSGLRFAALSGSHGPQRLLAPAYVVVASALLLLAASGRLASTAAAVVLLGAGLGLTIPALTLLLGRSVPARFQGRAAAASATAIFLGQFLAPLVIGPVVDRASHATGFAVAAAIAALAALVAAALPAATAAED